MAVKNFMEIIIDDEIDDIIQNIDMCKCDKCIDDIKAIALNNLKPRYCSTQRGEVFSKTEELRTQFRVEIIKEVIMAAEVVKTHEHHKTE